MRKTIVLLLALVVVLSFSACIQRAEREKLPSKTAAPTVAPSAQLSEEEIALIESELSELELLFSDIEAEEQIDVAPAIEL